MGTQRWRLFIMTWKGTAIVTGYADRKSSRSLDHLIATARERYCASFCGSCGAGAGFGDLQFQAAGYTKIEIAFFHISTICHWHTSMGKSSRQRWQGTVNRVLNFLLHFQNTLIPAGRKVKLLGQWAMTITALDAPKAIRAIRFMDKIKSSQSDPIQLLHLKFVPKSHPHLL